MTTSTIPFQLYSLRLCVESFCLVFPLNNNHKSKGHCGGRQQGAVRRELLRDGRDEGRIWQPNNKLPPVLRETIVVMRGKAFPVREGSLATTTTRTTLLGQ